MKGTTKKQIFLFAAALAAGVALHFVYQWLPNPVTALFSTVRESVWEHVKLVFWPLLAVSFLISAGDAATRAAWQLSALLVSLALAAVGYVYHIPLRGEAMAVDAILFVLAILGGFLLPRVLWQYTARPVVRWFTGLLVCIMAAVVVWFTFLPPDSPLFADLSQGLRTFLTIPV